MYSVVALYCFTDISDISQVESFLKIICQENDVKGNMIVAQYVNSYHKLI